MTSGCRRVILLRMRRSGGRWSTVRSVGIWISVTAVALGCSRVDRPVDDPFWVTFAFGPAADEIESYDSIAEMATHSDAIVVGRITSVDLGRVVHGDAAQDVVAYVTLTIATDRLIAGEAPPLVPVEFLGGSPASAEDMVARARAAGLPASQVVAFLHEKAGAGEAGLYRLVNSTAIWAATARSTLDTPVRDLPPSRSGLYRAEVARLAGLGDLIDFIENLQVESRDLV